MSPPIADRFAPARLLRRMGAVPEPAMRDAIWRECFEAVEADGVVIILQAVFVALDRGAADGRLAWLSLLRVLEGIRGGPTALSLYLAAKAAEAQRVLALLAEPPPARSASADALQGPPLDPERDVTLGERRAWARRPDRAVLERMLFDADPGVVRNVLANPRITEADVVRLAARRPNSAAVLQQVFWHPRWGRRAPVVEALVYNPHTPVDLACGLVHWLDAGLARRVLASPGVHALVRAEARRRVRGG